MADSQLFYLPEGTKIEVFQNEKVLCDYEPTDGGHRAEEDISNGQLGRILLVLAKNDLLEASSLEEFLLRAGSLRDVPNVSLHNVGKVMKGNGTYVKGSINLLEDSVRQTLLAGGVPADAVGYLSSQSGYARALNNSTNPVKAARTMMAKAGFTDRCSAWAAKNATKDDDVEFPKGGIFQID